MRRNIAVLKQDGPPDNTALYFCLRLAYKNVLFTLVAICIPLKAQFYGDGPHAILQRTEGPSIFCENINAHSQLWGGDRLDARGRTLKYIF